MYSTIIIRFSQHTLMIPLLSTSFVDVMSHSQEFYENVELAPWYAAYALFIFYTVYTILMRCLICCEDKRIVKKCAIAPYNLIELIAKQGLSAPTGLLLNTHRRKRVYINNKVVPKSILRIFGYHMFFCGLVIFCACWSIGLVEVTSSCNTDKRDCFATVENEGITPITNCSNYSSRNVTTMKCYHIIEKPGVAIGVAGGLLTFAKMFIKRLSQFLIWYYSMEGKTMCGHRVSRCFLRSCHFIGLIIFVEILPCSLTVLILEPQYYFAPLTSRTNLPRVIVIFFVVFIMSPLISMAIPWWYFTYDNEEPDETEEEREKREQLESREEELEGIQLQLICDN